MIGPMPRIMFVVVLVSILTVQFCQVSASLPPRRDPVDTIVHAASDPTCSTGIARKGACCPAICGKCGGSGCYALSRLHRTRCCAFAIVNPAKRVPSCLDSLPPCVMPTTSPRPSSVSKSVSPSPDPSGESPVSTLTGSWNLINYRRGVPVERHEACAVMVNGLVVLVGGRGLGKPVSIYNPKNGTWWDRDPAGKWVNIHHFQCVAIGSSVWIAASWKKFFPYEEVNENVYEYNVKEDKWYFWPPMPADRNRGGAAAVHRGDYIYVVAGNRGGHGAHATSLGWVDEFNWRTKEWTNRTFPDVPGSGRDHVGAALVNDEICIAGGRDGGTADFFNAVITTTYCYSFVTNKWSKKEDFPVGRAGSMTGTTCDGKMMIAGGEGFGKAFTDVHVFDSVTWERAPSLSLPRHSSGLAIARCDCGHIFIPSGAVHQGGRETNTTDRYIPKGAPTRCSRY